MTFRPLSATTIVSPSTIRTTLAVSVGPVGPVGANGSLAAGVAVGTVVAVPMGAAPAREP